MRFAAIDIGSNAIRLLVVDYISKEGNGKPIFKKLKLFRIPVRLGVEVFANGKISKNLGQQLIKTLQAFQLLMEIFEVQHFKAYATSALREATNKKGILEKVAAKTGIRIEVITGKKEAQVILNSNIEPFVDARFNYLYVDVGGGSTEISLYSTSKIPISTSFKIGTVRMMKKKAEQKEWDRLQQWLIKIINPKKPLAILGSGGNINRVYKRSGKKGNDPLLYTHIKAEREYLNGLTIDERIEKEDLTKDRAEVIVPALDIFLFVMEQTGITQIIVPKIGLSDGIIREIYQEQLVISN